MNPVSYNSLQLTPQQPAPLVRSPLYESLFSRPMTVSGPDNHVSQPHLHKPEADLFNKVFPNDDVKADKVRRVVKNLGLAVGLFGMGLILHNSKLPARASSFKWLSTDWKEWAKIGFGIGAANHINKAFDWKPPPWLGAVMAVGIINPLVLGFKKGLPQFAVMAPLVAGVVTLASWLSKQFTKKVSPALEVRTGKKIPEWVPKLAISALMVVVGLVAYPKLFKLVAGTGLLGVAAKEAAATNARTLMGTGGAVCFRGCCPSVICLSEIGEMVGGMRTGHKSEEAETHGMQTHPPLRFGHATEVKEAEKPALLIRILKSPLRLLQWFKEFFSNFGKDMKALVSGAELHHSADDGHDHSDPNHKH